MKALGVIACTFLLWWPAAAQLKPAKIADLSWLTGCWESSKPESGYLLSEQWMRPEGGMMIGMGRTVRDRKAQDWEFMRIEQTGDGLTFFAKPKANRDETPFKMTRMSESEIVFEDPAHDFPQKVTYRLTKTGSLAPSIEGMINGKLKTIEFPMQRVECR